MVRLTLAVAALHHLGCPRLKAGKEYARVALRNGSVPPYRRAGLGTDWAEVLDNCLERIQLATLEALEAGATEWCGGDSLGEALRAVAAVIQPVSIEA